MSHRKYRVKLIRNLIQSQTALSRFGDEICFENTKCFQNVKVETTSFILVPVRAPNSQQTRRTVTLKLETRCAILLPFEILDVGAGSTVSATTGTRSSEFKAHTFLKSIVQLQCYGSQSLLGVTSSDWYQNKADSLYFHVLKTFFVFKTNFLTKSEQNHLTLDQISDQLHSVFPM